MTAPAPTVAPRRHRPGDRGLPRVARDRARRHALRRRPADPGPQDVDLGVVALGAVIDVPFSFLNHCTNGSHLDADQVVSFTFAGGTAPDGGNILGGSDGSVGPAPAGWPGDGFTCPNTTMYLTGTAGTVTIQAPAAEGDYAYLISWDKLVDPARAGDSLAIRGLPALTIRLEVVANTAPVVTAPTSSPSRGTRPADGPSTGPASPAPPTPRTAPCPSAAPSTPRPSCPLARGRSSARRPTASALSAMTPSP